MIQPPGTDGVAFSDRSDGDMRDDPASRERLSNGLRIPSEWATVSQVHRSDVIEVAEPGNAGAADALWTRVSGLPLAVFTADCLGVVLIADAGVGVAHAGWRGVDAGVVARLREEMGSAGSHPVRAYVGPGIGPCCFEVGPEVAERFPGAISRTTWGTQSVDLAAALGDQLAGVTLYTMAACTMHEDAWYSHRQDGTPARLATLGWIR
ncbi:MAG TPA: polyphenol oxidase family protein [Acidimicrobiia bacterium]|nr:polyphenol oxidase family protein [Acidimicrobiia bacterium]